MTDDRLASYDGLPKLRHVIAEAGLSADKKFGQNFLFDLNLTARIARSTGPLNGTTVMEVGPGPGGLTRALLAEGAAKVIAVERDPRCIEALDYLISACPDRLTIVEGDALEFDADDLSGPVRIIANLPYNVATPLLTGWLHKIANKDMQIEAMALMFQKEVADRITAVPGTKAYGRLSVISQMICDVRAALTIPPSAFIPPPKVTSAVVHFVPKADAPTGPELAAIEKVTAAAFGQRRKMLRASLKPLGINPEDAGLDPTLRAENLTIDQFAALAKLL